jgi:AraC-like DNA-binding protein
MKYPAAWPKANPRRATTLASRITEQDKEDLYAKKVTAADIALKYGMHEVYVTSVFPGRENKHASKRTLIEARQAYRLELARQVMLGQHTILEAANIAHVSACTMTRMVNKAQTSFPDLVPGYKQVVTNRRVENAKKARDARKP